MYSTNPRVVREVIVGVIGLAIAAITHMGFFQSALPTTLPLPPFCLEEKHDTREGLLSYCLLCETHWILEVMNLNGVKT